MTDETRKTLSVWGYEGRALNAVGLALESQHEYEPDGLGLICPASMASEPKICHGACVSCPYHILREADETTVHGLGKLIARLIQRAGRY